MHYVKLLDKAFKYGLNFLVVLVLILVGLVLQYDLPWVSSEHASVFNILDMVLKTVVVISLLLLTIQSCLSRKHTDNTYVISRSQKSIDLLAQWSLEIGRDALIARHIVENLPLEECRKLYNYECIKIRSGDYNSLWLLLPKRVQERSCERTKQNLEQSEEISEKCPYWEACEAKK